MLHNLTERCEGGTGMRAIQGNERERKRERERERGGQRQRDGQRHRQRQKERGAVAEEETFSTACLVIGEMCTLDQKNLQAYL